MLNIDPTVGIFGCVSALMTLMSIRLKFAFPEVDEKTKEAIDNVSWYGLQFGCLFCYLGYTYG